MAEDNIVNLPTEENTDEDIVTLIDEDGNEEEFVVVDIIEVEYAGQTREYALLIPNIPDDADSDLSEYEEALVLRFEGDEMHMIEDDEEFQAVEAFLTKLEEIVENTPDDNA